MTDPGTLTQVQFSFNLFRDLGDMLHYRFMQHAFEAGTAVAVIAGIIGYFVVLRRSAFATHGLSHAGFTGAAGAVLLGINPIVGLFACTMSGALLMALLGKRLANRDVQIGVVVAFMLGLGILFINLYKGYATEAYSLLFGEILGISMTNVWVTLITAILVLAVFGVLYRPVLFTSLDEQVAEAKGMPVLGIDLAFMFLIAAAISIAVQVVGVLLIFALMVTPGAVALRLARRPVAGVLISMFIGLLGTWLGLFISYYQPYPVSFFITALTFAVYIAVRLWQAI